MPAASRCHPSREILRIALHAVPALLLIVLIVGGIRFGIFTPTEASVIAVFYALFVGMFVYRSLRIRDLPDIILRAALTSSAVLLILGAARAFAWILIIEGIPQSLAETIISWDLSPIVFLLAVNVLLLIFGLFMDPLPGVMILVPILAPISMALGIDPNHFAIVVIVNLTIGLATPPVGSLIFVVSSTTNLKPSRYHPADAALLPGACPRTTGDHLRACPVHLAAHRQRVLRLPYANAKGDQTLNGAKASTRAFNGFGQSLHGLRTSHNFWLSTVQAIGF